MYINADVALWLDCRQYKKKPQLHQHNGFLIMTESLMAEFETFKEDLPVSFSIIKSNELLELWISSSSCPAFVGRYTLYENQYVGLKSEQLDMLCQWVVDLRNTGKEALAKLIKVSHHVYNV